MGNNYRPMIKKANDQEMAAKTLSKMKRILLQFSKMSENRLQLLISTTKYSIKCCKIYR